jgi:hypothetical protein
MFRELVKVITVSVNEIKNKIKEIKKAFNLILNDLPMTYEKFSILFSDLTNCDIDFDIRARIENEQKLSENIILRVFYSNDGVKCDNLEFDVVSRVIDVFDNDKSEGIIVNIKIIDIKPHW